MVREHLAYKAGDATVHADLCAHGTGRNLTDRPRWAYIIGCVPEDACWNGARTSFFPCDRLTQYGPLDDAGSPVPRTLLFPSSEAEWSDIWDVIGLNGTGSDRYATMPNSRIATIISTVAIGRRIKKLARFISRSLSHRHPVGVVQRV